MQPTRTKDVEFILQRVYLGEYTIGKLYVADFILCDTLEDKVRDYNKDGDLLDAGETKIFGETAIPYGRYKMTTVNSPKFKRKVVLLHGVSHFESIEIHAGNDTKDTHGCILPGENTEKGKVTNSKYWEKIITMLVEAFELAGYNVYINII